MKEIQISMKALLIALCLLSNIAFASDRIYIDENEIDHSEDCFYIHTGGNIWLASETLHRDKTGIYICERNLLKNTKSEYEKRWKCPYCNMYWPVGKPCQNRDCPSRY